MTILSIDYETYSAVGYRWLAKKRRWAAPPGVKKTSIMLVGAEVYAMHPSTRVLWLAYGPERTLWKPGDPDPTDLWEHVSGGGLVGAWNSAFEYWVWRCCLHQRLGWPELPLHQLRDTMPRSRAFGYPGGLGDAAKVIGVDAQKDTRGKALIAKFSGPRSPTKKDGRLRNMPSDDPVAFAEFGEYCQQDVEVEEAISRHIPPLSPFEERVWLVDQEINARGIPIDVESVGHAIAVMQQAERALNAELPGLTDGAVTSHGQIPGVGKAWLRAQGVHPERDSMDAESLAELLERDDLPAAVLRVIEIRAALSSTSCKKLWAFLYRTAPDGRARGQLIYGGAGRTLRWSGSGIQVHNFPRGKARQPDGSKWNPEATETFLGALACRDYATLAETYGDVLEAQATSLRGLVKASPGHRLLVADYSAIEAVVLACLAGEEWRIDAFRRRECIYLASASKITGVPLEDYLAHKAETDENHPHRALGKVAELGSGYQGSIGAWYNFGADSFFTPERCSAHRDEWLRYTAKQASRGRPLDTLQDFAIRKQVWAWRNASPAIVAFWAGLQVSALAAVRRPGEPFSYRSITYQCLNGTLFCTLPSGRKMAYHEARIGPGRFGNDAVYYHGWNTNPAKGERRGWVELNTYGGKLTENVVQAAARDWLAFALVNLADAGYHTIFHVHDEIINEEPDGHGSLAEMISIMERRPDWASDWPIRAEGWEGQRFRKD
jgi:DNA polymerase